jgi:membrane associated rhomboid family serine protease
LVKVPHIQLPSGAATLPLVTLSLAAIWLLTASVVGLGYRGELSRADAELRLVARQVIHHPELEIPDRLLPVARDLMPGFESNEMFDFLRKEEGDGGAQDRFDARAAAALAKFDGHPTRRLGLVPAQPSVPSFFSYPIVHAGLLHALFTAAIVLLAGSVLERLWGWRLYLLGVALITLGGAGAYLLVHFDSDRALLGGGGIAAGLAAAAAARFRTEEIDLLGWLPESFSAELEAPAWLLLGVWGAYEAAAWLSMPIGVPGLAHSPGFEAHAGGAVLGVGVALVLERLGWEREKPVAKPRPATTQRLDLAHIQAMLEAGDGDAALEQLEAGVRRSARNRDAVTLYFRLCCEREQPERAAPAMVQLIREELRRGADDVAVARWRDLVAKAPDACLDPQSLLQIATLLRHGGDDELAVVALRQVMASGNVPASVAAEVARMAVIVAPELASEAAGLALADTALDEAMRAELEVLAQRKDESPVDEDVPVKPTGKELPPNAFYENQDRSEFGQLDNLSAVEEFPTGAVTDAVPRSLDLEGVTLDSEEHGEQRVDFSRVRAISVVGVQGLGPKPVLLIDLLVDGGTHGRPLAAFRLRSDRFDPRALAPGSNGGIEALRNVVSQLLAGSEGLPLPDAKSVVLRPPKIYDSLAAYEQDVLVPAGHTLA